MSKKRREKKILEMFATVIHEEHKKIALSKKAKSATKKNREFFVSKVTQMSLVTQFIPGLMKIMEWTLKVVKKPNRIKNRGIVKRLKIQEPSLIASERDQ
jgi:hypothetical protein